MIMEITRTEEIAMSSKFKTLVVAALLIAATSTAFAQRGPVAQSSQPTTETYSGPFSNMNRPE